MANEETLRMGQEIMKMKGQQDNINHPLIQKMLELSREDLDFMNDLFVKREREIQKERSTRYPFYIIRKMEEEACGYCDGCKEYWESLGDDRSDFDSKKILKMCDEPRSESIEQSFGFTRESVEETLIRMKHRYYDGEYSYCKSAIHNTETERFFDIIAKLGKEEKEK